MSEKTIKLLNAEIMIDKKTDMLNSIRKKYYYLGKEARKKMDALYDEKVCSLEDFRYYCKSITDNLFNSYLKVGVLELISYGIYDIDEIVLKSEFAKDSEVKYEKALALILSKIGAVEYEQRQLDAERNEMIAAAGDTVHTVGYISNGDIGDNIETIVSSGIQDAAINAVFAGGTALLTGGIRAIEKKGAESEKQKIFESLSTKQSILIGMEQDVFAIYKTVARLINERVEEVFYYPSTEALEKIEPIIRNILGGNFSNADFDINLEAKQIENVLKVNPYEMRIYSYVLQKQNGINAEIKDAIDYLCIDMKSIADSYLRALYRLSDYKTYESMVDFVEVVKKEMVPFDINDCDFYMEATARRDELFRLRKTFNGYEYETIEKRDEAEDQFLNFFNENVNEMDIDDLVDKYFETLPSTITPKNREDLQKIIMVPLGNKIDGFSDSASLMTYFYMAEEKRVQYNFQTLTLIDAINKKLKKLTRKENFSNAVGMAKEKTAAATESVKKAGKDLLGKLPFGKKTEQIEGTIISETIITNDDKLIEATAPAQAALPEQPETKACPQCGNQVLIDKKFCGKCGHKF